MGVLLPLLPFGYSSPTREECSPISWKYCYPLPAGFPLICPTENTFGGDPDRSPLKGNPPFRGTPDAIDALRSNRYTFGAARRDWRRAQQSLDLRHSGMRASEDGASAAPPCYAACNAPASRREWRIAGALHVSPTRLTLRVTIAIPSVRHFEISYGVPAGKISDFSRGARGAALKRASPCERLVSGSTSNEITSCQGTSRSKFSLNRLRKRNVVLGDALSNACRPDALIWMQNAKAPLSRGGAYL